MAETLVEEKKCAACGADVRPGSMFCYNCGGPVALELADKASEKAVSSAWFKGDLASDQKVETTRLDEVVLPVVESPAENELADEPVAAKAEKKPTPESKKRARTTRPKAGGVVWEEPESGPNAWFPLVAVLLLVFVFIIYVLAEYLK